MKDIFYTQIVEIIIVIFIFTNHKYNYFEPDFEKYLMIGLIIGLIYSITKMYKFIHKA